MLLPPSEIHLWVVPIDESIDEDLLSRYRALMSVDELQRADRYAFDRHRRRHVVTRALVRTVLSAYAPSVQPQDWVFRVNDFGCPCVVNPVHEVPQIRFNLSHTDACVVLAVRAQGALGVDVEPWDRRVQLDIAEHFFCSREVDALRRLPSEQQAHRFMTLWTFKESYIKARQMGLAIPLDQFGFDIAGHKDVSLFLDPTLGDSPQRWHFLQLQPLPGHVVALCAERLDEGAINCVVRQVLPLIAWRPLNDVQPLRASTH